MGNSLRSPKETLTCLLRGPNFCLQNFLYLQSLALPTFRHRSLTLETTTRQRNKQRRAVESWEASKEVLLRRGCWLPRPRATSFRLPPGLWRQHRPRGRWENGKAQSADGLPPPPACRQCLRLPPQQHRHKLGRRVSGTEKGRSVLLLHLAF